MDAERLRQLKQLEESVFVVKYELEKIGEFERALLIESGKEIDINLFMLFKDCDMLRRKLSVISDGFFNKKLDIKELAKEKQ